MNLEVLFKNHKDQQVVLSLSNNNDVVITSECFNPDSKFYRMSRVRLAQDYVFVGYYQDNHLVLCQNECDADNTKTLLYRTYRGTGKNDYLVFIHNDYQVICNTRKHQDYSSIIKSTKDKQLSIKDFTKPIPDRVLDFTMKVNHDDTWRYRIIYRSPLFTTKEKMHVGDWNKCDSSWRAYHYAVLSGLKTAKLYMDKIDVVRIFIENDCPKSVYKIAMNEWTPRYDDQLSYWNMFNELKDIMSDNKITIEFVFDARNNKTDV